MMGLTRTFLVEGGELVFPADLTLSPPMRAVDQTGGVWFKADFDVRWRRANSEDDSRGAPVPVMFRRG